MADIAAVNDEEFESNVLKAAGPVLVDFWAEWCGPCKMITPILEEVATEMGEEITIFKLNIDDNPVTPSDLGVRGIPTLMIFKNGECASTKVGALPKGQIIQWIKESV
ncbi:MAG: thioredoxin TrxA [Pseudomonadota bacterium]|nr:thioredoxin TrxA [Pseudomonadota bacterium]